MNSSSRDKRASSPATGGRPSVAAHTPGPWSVEGASDINGHYLHIGAPSSAVVLASMNPRHVHVEANARLISAAPDLLEALAILAGPAESGENEAETAVPHDSPVTITCQLGDLRRAWAAIAKATDEGQRARRARRASTPISTTPNKAGA